MNLGNLPAQLFSPFKFGLILLGTLIALDKIEIGGGENQLSICALLLITLLGILLEIGHNDYYRIILNGNAEKKFEWKQKNINSEVVREKSKEVKTETISKSNMESKN